MYRKISPQAALYFGPALNKYDFSCQGCMFWLHDTKDCTLLEPSHAGPNDGCALFVPGKSKDNYFAQPTYAVPRAVASFGEGPFSCKRCAHFEHPNLQISGRCEVVEGLVHGDGCCSAWRSNGH
jgi:hypothetical protein